MKTNYRILQICKINIFWIYDKTNRNKLFDHAHTYLASPACMLLYRTHQRTKWQNQTPISLHYPPIFQCSSYYFCPAINCSLFSKNKRDTFTCVLIRNRVSIRCWWDLGVRDDLCFLAWKSISCNAIRVWHICALVNNVFQRPSTIWPAACINLYINT